MAHIKAENPQEQEYFDYLEELRQFGVTNNGAASYIEDAFDLPHKYARDILWRWMQAHDGATRKLGGTGE